MAVKVKITPFNRKFNYVAPKGFSREDQTLAFAEFAQERIDDAKAQNARVLGAVPPYTVSVDGMLGAPLTSAKPNNPLGVYVEFELVFEALSWIGEMLEQFSPVGKAPKDKHPGLYKRSHVMIADGVAVDDGKIPPLAKRISFTNIQPYARKIERGLSPQRPDGVYQAVAVLAARKFSNLARIKFGYETPMFGAVHEWASSPSGAAWARAKRKGSSKGHAEWLRRQPAIIVTLGS
jgi:hypothetical protein